MTGNGNGQNGYSNTMGREYTDDEQEICDEIAGYVGEIVGRFVNADGQIDGESLLVATMWEFNGEYGYTHGNICTDVVEYVTLQIRAGRTIPELSSELVGR